MRGILNAPKPFSWGADVRKFETVLEDLVLELELIVLMSIG